MSLPISPIPWRALELDSGSCPSVTWVLQSTARFPLSLPCASLDPSVSALCSLLSHLHAMFAPGSQGALAERSRPLKSKDLDASLQSVISCVTLANWLPSHLPWFTISSSVACKMKSLPETWSLGSENFPESLLCKNQFWGWVSLWENQIS